MSFDKIIDLYDRPPVEPRYRTKPQPLLATAYQLVDELNQNLPTQRQTMRYVVEEIVRRESTPASALRAVTQFVSTMENPNTATPTKHTDLLYPGHPLSTAEVENRRAFVAQYFSTEALVSEEEQPLVASVISADPNSAQRKFYLAQLSTDPSKSFVKFVIEQADAFLSTK